MSSSLRMPFYVMRYRRKDVLRLDYAELDYEVSIESRLSAIEVIVYYPPLCHRSNKLTLCQGRNKSNIQLYAKGEID